MNSKTAIAPGSFDPITIGHENVILRAAKLFDKITVAVCNNSQKKYCFSLDERFFLCQTVFEPYPNITVVKCKTLLTKLYQEENACAIIKGVRNMEDCGYEFELATINQEMGSVETLLFPCKNGLGYISSKMVREFGTYGADIIGLVPDSIEQYVSKKFGTKE